MSEQRFFEHGMSYGGDLIHHHHHHRQISVLKMIYGTMQAGDETKEDDERLRLQQSPRRLKGNHHWRCKTEVENCVNVASDKKGSHMAEREKKRRKSKRSAAAADSQRMNHSEVERNRRRLMNDHLIALKDLIPPSFIHRGDQASIVGGAIDFVKELEQRLLSLLVDKQMRTKSSFSAATSSFATAFPDESFLWAPQYTSYSSSRGKEGADVEAAVVTGGHVNLNVYLGRRRREGQLVKAVAALEELRLAVLHLNVTTLDADSIFYSFNLKMEDGCELSSADEIATAVYQIFTFINPADGGPYHVPFPPRE